MNIRQMGMIALFAALTAITGFLSFPLPFTPVPFTLQLVFSTMAGFVLGKKYGALSQVIYLLIGAAGVPVFANRLGGLAILVGPTGGFLISFPLAAYLIGLLAERYRPQTPFFISLILYIGVLLVYVCGVVGLMIVSGIGPVEATAVGVVPFLLPDMLKVFLATVLIYKLRKHNAI